MRKAYILENAGDNIFDLHFSEPPHYTSFRKELDNSVDAYLLNENSGYYSANLHSLCNLSTGIHLIAAAPHHILEEKEAATMLLWGCFLTFDAFEALKLGLK